MLNLTKSFCRYLKFTINTIHYNKIHVRNFAFLSCRRKESHVDSNQNTSYATPFGHTGQQLRLLANIKKRFRLQRVPVNSNEKKKSGQMSDSFQPTLSHVCYGGQFETSTDASSSDFESQSNNSRSTTSSEQREPCAISPDFRVWEPVVKRDDVSGGGTFKFKLVSYNVLAQYLLECHPYLYTECSSYNLKWRIRAARLYDEIMKLAPDIICLQEVQASHLNSFYARFEKVGYCGIYKQKTGHHRQDGCAIYFKQSLFDMQDQVSVEYYQPDLPILNRDNIGIMVKLMPKNYSGQPIVVATTHLLYNPNRTDVRLAQLQVLLAEIDRFAYYHNGRECGHLPIILTGDFNSTPDSPVIKLLDRGQVSASAFRDSSDWRRIGVTDNCQHLSVYLNRQNGLPTNLNMTKIYNSDYSASNPNVGNSAHEGSNHYEMFNSGSISHCLNLSSIYSKLKQDGSQEATTFQDYWTTVDYIYFSYCSALRLVERLRLPTVAECDVLGRLPNDVYASDHLALAATFELKPRKSAL